jgi:hypothetical protein
MAGMRLEVSNGNSLALHIDGYEFGRSADRFDSNWLVVSGDVQLPPLQWRFTSSPCVVATKPDPKRLAVAP